MHIFKNKFSFFIIIYYYSKIIPTRLITLFNLLIPATGKYRNGWCVSVHFSDSILIQIFIDDKVAMIISGSES